MEVPVAEQEIDRSRRVVMGGLVGIGLGGPLLAACGSSSDSSSGSGSGSGSGSSSGGSSSGGGSASGGLGPTSEIPVGGGKIFSKEKVVVTQPTQGQFKAFSATCTHQGCLVSKIEGKDIDCTCHGSKFSIEDGSVVNGPAKEPLKALSVSTTGGQITVT